MPSQTPRSAPALSPDRRDAIARRLAGIAREAGDCLLRYRDEPCPSALKADGSPVSAADLAAETLIRTQLAAAFPHWPVVSEEHTESHAAAAMPIHFLVDPLDGTRPFLSGGAEFCVLIALIAGGNPIAGAIHAPVSGRSWWAGARAFTAAGRASRRGRALPQGERRLSVAIVSRDQSGEDSRPLCAACGAVEIRRENSALKFARLADGEADIYPRRGRTMQWDIAAGDALLRALGGGVFDLDGKPLVYGPGPDGWASPDFIACRRAPPPACR
ncbi:3'(2'),5'-bisphosphate nucleotidase CysQ family protein [Rhabdaerophilum calidifontis]|uniref:3'(2'),5'-bisphosphate nucleotidase CysQ family protein n=1 Tax=Rhabdaerophilum calidifontis TaxID=2604328 RepID=UPI00123B1271|nr:3'(2'),5'-bisphosphate nucleotidase CysQ [Rhabdaerophilum calidifontis]